MFLPRMLAGLLVVLQGVVACAQVTKSVTPPAASAPATPAEEKNSSQPEVVKSDTPPQPAEQTEQKEAVTPELLQQWIKDLVHQKFATRQGASQKLVQAGVAGMEAAAEAAKTEDLELATRCLAVLTEGLNSKEKTVRDAAKGALETLARSDNKSVAQRARQALDTPRGLPEIPGALALRNGRNFQQIRVQVVNGINGFRELTVQENGKEIVIKENNRKDISVTVTETVNGQKQTQTFKGNNEEELKKNHPEAHALFERYTKGNGAMRIQINGNIFVPVMPQQARRRILNPIKAADLLDEVEKLRRKLEESNGRLEKAANSDKPDPAELKQISEEIKTSVKRLTEIHSESQLP